MPLSWGGSIYFSFGTGAHAIYGLIRDKWRSIGAETSYLGFPVTDEQAVPSKYSKFGSRENKFEAGRVIADVTKKTTSDLGFYASVSSGAQARTARIAGSNSTTAVASQPYNASDIPPPGQVPASSDGCPSGTSYTNTPEWTCEWVQDDLNGQEYWGRKGLARGASTANQSGDDISNGFGVAHTKQDHNLTSRAVQLLVRAAPYCIPIFRKPPNDFNRCEFGTNVVAMPSGEVTDQIVVVEQTDPDSRGRSPDQYQLGIVTAFCRTGLAGVLKEGYCDDEWMGPFRNIGVGE